ncbi:MAG: hypothetical protein WBK37_04895 [Kiritimatiellia bacterium]|nr:MAG: hypothetical protein BWX54_02100 [Verrucomicrobia bacterium ADurb.Bin018]HOR78526.1 hypothetical protein [Anaerolineaceae bacterium]HOU59934.1 hypothetical protein [Kiritimatiellia bacterium]HQM24198.1 hypothetical protein [Kiritimatiellia bacterium]
MRSIANTKLMLYYMLSLCSLFFPVKGEGEGYENSSSSQSLLQQLIRAPVEKIDPVVVAVGNYQRSYVDHINGTINNVTYSISESYNGQLSTNVVIMFDGGTAPVEFPNRAILLLTPVNGDDGLAYALGNVAEYGIVPFTLEKWAEVKAANYSDLAKNKAELQLALPDAMKLVEQDWLQKGAGADAVLTAKYDAVRRGYGWSIHTLKPTGELGVYVPICIHEVSDSSGIVMRPSLSRRVVVSTNGEVFYQ